jgi:iron-sulfur cluster insertion protein|tara:strand:- start:51 stop:389 length:339 start_codon:yes stop_codon:yes gene_type:complete
MITIEQSAIDKIIDLHTYESDKNIKGLRMFVQGGGCSGFQYGFTWETEEGTEEDDTVLDLEGTNLKVIVDVHSNQYLDGSVVAYTKTLMAEQFQIKNPSASASCGCGSSFAV